MIKLTARPPQLDFFGEVEVPIMAALGLGFEAPAAANEDIPPAAAA